MSRPLNLSEVSDGFVEETGSCRVRARRRRGGHGGCGEAGAGGGGGAAGGLRRGGIRVDGVPGDGGEGQGDGGAAAGEVAGRTEPQGTRPLKIIVMITVFFFIFVHSLISQKERNKRYSFYLYMISVGILDVIRQ